MGAVSRDDGKPMPLSPSIGVENIDHHEADFIIGENAGQAIHDPAFSAARLGMAALSTTAEKLYEAEAALKTGRDLDASSVLRLQRGIQSMLASTDAGLAAALKTLDEHRTKAADEIENALGVVTSRTSVTDNQRAGEVRAMLRAMPEKDRASVLQDAVRESDAAFVAAVLVSPRLAGLNAEDAATLRANAESTLAPVATKRRDGIDALARRLRVAGAEIAERFGVLIGVGDSAAARAERALAGLVGTGNGGAQ